MSTDRNYHIEGITGDYISRNKREAVRYPKLVIKDDITNWGMTMEGKTKAMKLNALEGSINKDYKFDEESISLVTEKDGIEKVLIRFSFKDLNFILKILDKEELELHLSEDEIYKRDLILAFQPLD